jgi:tetratricopeptide (TPR) repeat protein
MLQQVEWARGKPEEYFAADWQARTMACAGQMHQSQILARRAIDLATHVDVKEVAASYATEQALSAAILGSCEQAKAYGEQTLALERNQVTLARVALSQALCRDTSQAQVLIDELTRQHPSDTIANGLWAPIIRAAIELAHGNGARAVELLEPTRTYESAAEFWPQYVRGLAYLKINKGAEAAAEFQRILDHRGEAPLSILYPLAHRGLAEAAAVSGDKATARKMYKEFLALWIDADSDIPVLRQARQVFAALK